MKKITSLLMLSLAFAGTAWAQTPEGSKLPKGLWSITASTSSTQEGSNGAVGTIIDGNPQTYWHSNYGAGTGFNQGGNCPHYFVIDMKQSVNVTGFSYTPRQHTSAANGTCKSYEFYVSDAPFSNVKAPAANKSEVDAYNTGLANADATGTMEENTQEKVVALNKAKQGRYVLFVIKDATGHFGNCAEFDVYSTTSIVEKKAQVTYTYKLGDATKTQTVEQIVGTNYAAPAIDFVTFTQPEGTVKEGANNVTVTCTEALPFEKTTDLQNPKWLSIDMHSNQNRYMWHYDGDNTNIKVAVPEDLVSISKDEAYFWCLTGNVFDGFKIYNKKAGTSKTLNKTSGKPQITEDKATVWQIVKPQSTVTNAACFKAEGTDFLNHQADTTLGYWSNADEGSSCRFFKPATLAMEQGEVYAHIPENAVGGFVGVENIDPTLTAAENDPYNFDKANALVDAIKALKNNGVTFEEGAYYRIISAFPNFEENQQVKKCMLAVNGNEYIRWGVLAMNDVNNVFQLEKKSNNKFCLKNANRGKYMQGVAGLLGDKENAADMDFVDLGAAQYNIRYTNGNCHTNGHNNGKGQSGDLISWNGGQNSASAWYLVKATDIEVALANVGEASYATAYLPFSVSNVAGATAFVGKKAAEGNALNMTSVASIPANTGVVLKGAKDADKAVLTIGVAAAVEGNELQGTLVEKNHENELVLGNNEGKIGFYGMNAGAKIGANKAFLPATAAGAQSFVLNFDGEATAIESVMGETNTDAPVYDLSGRRVVKTVKGGLYIQNGKKFIVR